MTSSASGTGSDAASSPVSGPQLGNGEVLVYLNIVSNCEVGLNYLGQLSQPPSPIVIGYGTAGTVVAVGPGCSVGPGAKVAVKPLTPCRRCTYCRGGWYTACIGSSLRTPRALNTEVTLPSALVTPLPFTLTYEEGALIQPLSLATVIMERADLSAGQRFAVFGASFIGIMCCLLARKAGVTEMMIVDTDQDRLNVARQFVWLGKNDAGGIEFVKTCVISEMIDAAGGAATVVQTFGGKPNVCVNATGNGKLMDVALGAAEAGGRYVHAGIGESDIDWEVRGMFREDVTIHGGVGCEGADFGVAVGMVKDGNVSLREFCI